MSIRTDNEIVGGAGGMGGGIGSGGLIEGLLFGTILNGRNGGGLLGGSGSCGDGLQVQAGDIASKVVSLQNSANLGASIANVGTQVASSQAALEAVTMGQTAGITNEFSSLKSVINGGYADLSAALCASGKDSIRSTYEATIANINSTNALASKISDLGYMAQSQLTGVEINLKDQINTLSSSVDHQFCEQNHLITAGNAAIALQGERNTNALALQMERGFAKVSSDALEAELRELRDERDCARNRENTSAIVGQVAGAFSNQISNLANILDSQLTKQTQQIITFGNANAAKNDNTTNQVK